MRASMLALTLALSVVLAIAPAPRAAAGDPDGHALTDRAQQGRALPGVTPAAVPDQELHDIVQAHVARDAFMGNVLVAHGGRIVFDGSYGDADRRTGERNTQDTRFPIGSLSKQFTAAALLLLAEEGRLDLSDPLRVHLADVPPSWSGITIFHLLTHTSGIPNFTALPEYRTMRYAPGSPDTAIALVRDRPVEFVPGIRKNYSNSGYMLLGRLIEQLAGMTYDEFVRERLLDPLGMTETRGDTEAGARDRLPTGHAHSAQGVMVVPHSDLALLRAAGSLTSTPRDLLRWVNALFGGEVLKPTSLQAMITPFRDDYALGVASHSRDGVKVIEHFGGVNGFSAHFAHYPEMDLTVIVFANIRNRVPAEIAREMGRRFAGITTP
jgi:CubicO group peptidase (beta-lactamase class C family)